MPAGVAPAGSATGELGSSVRVPPLLMAKAPTVSTRLSFTYSVRPSGLTLGSVAPTPAALLTTGLPMSVRDPLGAIWLLETSPDPVFTANRNLPLGLMATQQGAVWSSGTGLAPIDVSDPLKATL